MHITVNKAIRELTRVYDVTFISLAHTEDDIEEDIEDLADAYKNKLKIARTVLDRIGGVDWGDHPAMGDVTIAVKRHATEEEHAAWLRLDEQICDLYDKIRGDV